MAESIADGPGIYRWNGSGWDHVSDLPAAITSSPGAYTFSFGTADSGQGDRVYFLAAFSPYTFNPATFAWTDETPTLGVVAGLGGGPNKVIRFDTNNQTSLCFVGGMFGVGGSGVGGDWVTNSHAGMSFVPSPGFARFYCPTPPCPADFNHSGGVTVDDIFDFLTAWLAGC